MIKRIKKRIKKIIKKMKNDNFKELGLNTVIHKSNQFINPENISIGDNVYIGFDGFFVGQGGIKIDSGSILAHNVEIMTRNHNYDSDDLQSIPYDHRFILRTVHIKENVWVGSNVKIVPGVTIGEGAVVAMGSVVTKNIPNFAVVGGNPAKILKFRDIEKYRELKKSNKIYLKQKSENLFK